MPFHPQLSFVSSSKVDPNSQSAPHQSQEVEQRSSGSLALTRLLGPSIPAPVWTFQSCFPFAFSCTFSLPQRYRGGSGLHHRRLQLLLPGWQSQRGTLVTRRPRISDNSGWKLNAAVWGNFRRQNRDIIGLENKTVSQWLNTLSFTSCLKQSTNFSYLEQDTESWHVPQKTL